MTDPAWLVGGHQMSPEPTQEVIDATAETLFGMFVDTDIASAWEDASEWVKDQWREMARTVVDSAFPALLAAGWVPPEEAEALHILLQQIDGQLGLGIYREPTSEQWREEAVELVGRIRRTLKGGE